MAEFVSDCVAGLSVATLVEAVIVIGCMGVVYAAVAITFGG